MAPVIELVDVAFAFGDRVVFAALDLAIERGETTFIIGRSGSGKTTLLKLMNGLATPDRGEVRVAVPREQVAMVFESYALFDALTVRENIEFPLREVAHASRAEARARAQQAIEALGLAGSEDVLPGELSGGMRKRVGVARALVSRPEVVLFDEPTTGLDPIMVERVDALIAQAVRDTGLTAIVVNHDLASVRRLAERCVVLHEGSVVFSGTPDELFASELPLVRELCAHDTTVAPDPSRTAGAPLVELVGVHKRFGDKHVLRGVSLAIAPRRITALIGGSGSGKSVMMKLVMGLLAPDGGEIRVAPGTTFGLVFQHAALLDWLTAEDNIRFPLVEQRGVSRDEVDRRVAELVDKLALGDLLRRMPSELSPGERKRVAVARALITRPSVLIYDEPTTGQDPVHTHEIDDLIVATHARFDVTTIIISHDIAAILRIAHTVAMLHEGQIVATGTPAELRASTDEHVQAFVRTA